MRLNISKGASKGVWNDIHRLCFGLDGDYIRWTGRGDVEVMSTRFNEAKISKPHL